MLRLALKIAAVCMVTLALLPATRGQEYDLVIRGARIVDGTGLPAYSGAIAVHDGRIAAVGFLPIGATAKAEIDAAGLVVAPGFIDVHTHSEDICELPVAENLLRMGVTTLVTGNCGSSRPDVGEFFAEITRTRVAVNVGTLIGHGSVRGQVMGGNFARPPTAAELGRMREIVDRAMRDGALGLSTGLIYTPGIFASTDEIIELAKIAAAHGGLYASHMRHENARIREALAETLRVGREARLPVEISHIKLSSPAAWGQAEEIIAYLDAARAEGLTITHDQYVYTAASTSIGSNLIDAQFREGGAERYRERLADPTQKARMIADMKASIARSQRGSYSYAVIANFPADPKLNGLTIPQAAKLLRGVDTLDDQIETILDIEARGGAQGVFHGISEPDIQAFLVHPLTMIASDGGPQKAGNGVPHPRSYGNNARVLGRYVRELKLLSLEEAVRKMTSLPARTFHLGNRGEIKTGYVADLVIFDPEKVADLAVYGDSHHFAAGFTDVIVNGTPVIRAGELTAARPGRPVRLNEAATDRTR